IADRVIEHHRRVGEALRMEGSKEGSQVLGGDDTSGLVEDSHVSIDQLDDMVRPGGGNGVGRFITRGVVDVKTDKVGAQIHRWQGPVFKGLDPQETRAGVPGFHGTPGLEKAPQASEQEPGMSKHGISSSSGERMGQYVGSWGSNVYSKRSGPI